MKIRARLCWLFGHQGNISNPDENGDRWLICRWCGKKFGLAIPRAYLSTSETVWHLESKASR